MKVQFERFHLNGHTTGFRPQTQKLQLPFKTPFFTLAVKGLKTKELTIPTIFSHNIKAKRDLELPGTLYTKYPQQSFLVVFLDKGIFMKGGLIQASALQN